MTQAVDLDQELSRPLKKIIILLFLGHYLSFQYHNSRISILAGPSSWFFWQAVFISLFHYHCCLVIHNARHIKGQYFQLLGSRRKYLLRWNRHLRQYLVPVNIHLAWLSFCPSDKQTHFPFINRIILEPYIFWNIYREVSWRSQHEISTLYLLALNILIFILSP